MTAIKPSDLALLLENVQKPGRYVGGEWHSVKKDPSSVDLKIALVFPDLYEVGMSYLGQKILYHLLNREPAFLAERVFAPWPDFEDQLRRARMPLFSLENRIPLIEFDILGFSLLYELNYSNILTILDLGKIPFLAADRDLSYPWVIAGGPAAFNPEPVAGIFDAFLLGDGEQAFLEITATLQNIKRKRMTKAQGRKSLADIPGVYVPSLYSGFVPRNSKLEAGKPDAEAPKAISKRVFFPLSDALFPEDIIVPNLQVVFDRVSMEVARGCPQNCRFCQARQIYFPARVKNAGIVKEAILRSAAGTGYEDVSLAALSVGDYPCLDELISDLMVELDPQKIALSLSSLRPKGLTAEVAENIIRVRKTGFTLVPEAGTERLRRVINKHLSDAEIGEAVDNAFSHGWRKLKLYFMLGLPTEKEEDIQGIVSLVEDVVRRGYRILKKPPQINLSVASFIPKPHTPFQWLEMTEERELREKHAFLRSRLRKYGFVQFKEHGIKTSILEAVFSRGDRRLLPVLIAAWQSGARFDSWRDEFDSALWEQAFQSLKLDPRQYLGPLDTASQLPWDHIETGLKKSYLLAELGQALAGNSSPPCTPDLCRNCAGCVYGFRPPDLPGKEHPRRESVWKRVGRASETRHRYRLTYSKSGDARYTSHIEVSHILQRAFRRAGIHPEFSQGFHPKMLLSFTPALALGMEGRQEIMEFRSRFIFTPEEFLSALNDKLPPGITAFKLQEVGDEQRRLNTDLVAMVYSLSFSDPAYQAALSEHARESRDQEVSAAQFARNRIKEAGVPTEDTEFYRIELDAEQGKINFTIFWGPGKRPRVQDLVSTLFSIENPAFHLVREKIVLKTQDSA
jgi:radical SAM family uncharacterized protein/radical SAM-linked protein